MIIKRNILLNPGPSTTTDTVKMAQIVPDICPREKDFTQIMKPMRDDLVRIVHGNPEDYTAVLFCGSGTICMDIALNSLLDSGKKALILNNGSYSERACDICRYYGLPLVEIKQPIDEFPDVSAIEKAFSDNQDIGYVYVTYHETGTGLLNPVADIGRIAHEHDAFLIADTTSAFALIPINLYAENIDFCMASSQKGISGMTGLSFIIGKHSIIKQSSCFPKRSYYCNLFMQYDYFERTGEMHFTPPVQTIYAAKQALLEYYAEGEEAKWSRHTRVMNAIRAGIDELGLHETLSRDIQSGLVATIDYPNDPNWDFEKVHDYCYKRGFTIYPGKILNRDTFRLCAFGAIDEQDIRDFWTAFRDALITLGVKIPIKQ